MQQCLSQFVMSQLKSATSTGGSTIVPRSDTAKREFASVIGFVAEMPNYFNHIVTTLIRVCSQSFVSCFKIVTNSV